ncbi:MAG: TonB-dependent receptor [Brumimicrobium sp.]|nr:TonB-dependent receptor [Brumimicrobium sp.]
MRIFFFFSTFLIGCLSFAQTGTVTGKITNKQNAPITHVKVSLKNTDYTSTTNEDGEYQLEGVSYGKYMLIFNHESFAPDSVQINIETHHKKVDHILTIPIITYGELEVIGNQNKRQNDIEAITRIPINPADQIQNTYVLDEMLFTMQDAQQVSDATRNISGISVFATHGGVRQSMSIRGFRGVPLLKNGILISKDTGGRGFASDFEGIESVQVIKGANSLNMGAATSYGNAGGMINLVTKNPRFVNQGKVSMRYASFNSYRPTFDIEGLIGKNNKAAFRIDGAYENARNYQNIKGVGKESFYINPSLAFRPDNKTNIILEMDYYNISQTFDPGTVNLDPQNERNELYELPQDQFLGFIGNNITQKLLTSSLRVKRNLLPKLYIRGTAIYSNYDSRGTSSALSAIDSINHVKVNEFQNTIYKRSIERSKEHSDKNFVAQIDLVGDHIQTGIVTHTFQAGFDFRTYNVEERKFNSMVIDTIDVLERVTNDLPKNLKDFSLLSTTLTTTVSTGISAQEIIDIADRVTIMGGVRLGTSRSSTPTAATTLTGFYLNPYAGLKVRLWKEISLFGNYTNTSDPQNAQFLDENNKPLGAETFQQFETGIKTSWFNKRLRASAVYYRTINNGMNMQAAIRNENTGVIELQNYYFKGGLAVYQGIEVDVIGQIGENWYLAVGFAKMEGVYKESTKFTNGSSVKNIPDYTANAYVNYSFNSKSVLKGLSMGVGFYYIGKMAHNDWTNAQTEYHGIVPGLEPWDQKAYYTLNANLGYDFVYSNNPILRGFNIRLNVNNITNSIGYQSYRLVTVNRITPLNYSVSLSYRF